MAGLAGEEVLYPNLDDALETERVMHAILRSSTEARWVAVD